MSDLQYIPGVGPKRAELLQTELHVDSLEGLLGYYPYRYVDKSRIHRICDLRPAADDGDSARSDDGANMPWILLRGHFTLFEEIGKGAHGPQHRLSGLFTDGTGTIECVWFNGIRYVEQSVQRGQEYILFGQPKTYGHKLSIAHPELEVVRPDEGASPHTGLYGMYNTTEKMKRAGLNSKAIQRIILGYLQKHPEPIAETLPAYIVEQLHLMPYNQAIRQIHFPFGDENLRKAQYRLKFEELFYLQLYLLRAFRTRHEGNQGFVFGRIAYFFNTYYHQCIPFELTDAQKRVLREIRADVGSGQQMNRLLQGDVGAGKTMVAILTMLMALDNGFQACMMAPTEILATQHYESLRPQLESIGVRVALLTGSTTKKRRELILDDLINGELHILIGTHALIEPTVQFRNLGMVIIDEQHRFGVEQRAKLWAKNSRPPHVLVMTATPIPRTLAMTVYGDLDVSVIDQLPPGRKPIATLHRHVGQMGLTRAIRGELDKGRQVYVVYPLVAENEKLDYQAVEQGFLEAQAAFGPEYRVAMVHGKMKAKDKDAAMQRFARNEAQVLVATTVIEVGVNVPNASVMVIQNAERFGLSQLHQLRGRVGRGAEQSYCVLVTKPKLAQETRQRIEVMCSTTDGFEIAEADLRLRGPGDLEGTMQSGLAFDLHIASLAKDGRILEEARRIAKEVLDRDPMFEAVQNGVIRRRMQQLFAGRVDWSQIS